MWRPSNQTIVARKIQKYISINNQQIIASKKIKEHKHFPQ